MLEVKYKIRRASKECLYAIIIACPMILDFWKAYNYDLAVFGEGLMVCAPESKGNFTFFININYIDLSQKRTKSSLKAEESAEDNVESNSD